MLSILARNLTRLAAFRGRMPRRAFWIYAGSILVPGFLAFQALFWTVFWMGRLTGPGEALPGAGALFDLLLLLTLGGVMLIASAVSRRLHDCGLSGYLGAAPLIFMAFGLSGVSRVMHGLLGETPPPLPDFFWPGLALYLAVLAVIGVLLSRPGAKGENRYGPPPGE